jgi:cell division protein FtsW (lipid II flippase)
VTQIFLLDKNERLHLSRTSFIFSVIVLIIGSLGARVLCLTTKGLATQLTRYKESEEEEISELLQLVIVLYYILEVF